MTIFTEGSAGLRLGLLWRRLPVSVERLTLDARPVSSDAADAADGIPTDCTSMSVYNQSPTQDIDFSQLHDSHRVDEQCKNMVSLYSVSRCYKSLERCITQTAIHLAD